MPWMESAGGTPRHPRSIYPRNLKDQLRPTTAQPYCGYTVYWTTDLYETTFFWEW
jgi:hypothetical protein